MIPARQTLPDASMSHIDLTVIGVWSRKSCCYAVNPQTNPRGVLMSWAGRDGGKDFDVGLLNTGAPNHLNLDEMAMRLEEEL